MTTVEDGAQFVPSRKPKFIPIEEVHPGHIAAGFLTDAPQTPEDILLAKEEEEKAEHTLTSEDDLTPAEIKMLEEIIAHEALREDDEEYPWEEQEAVDEYNKKLDHLAKKFEHMDTDAQWEAFVSKYHLPPSKKEDKEKFSKLIAAALHKDKGTFRSPEPKGKHQKGQETIRRFGIDE